MIKKRDVEVISGQQFIFFWLLVLFDYTLFLLRIMYKLRYNFFIYRIRKIIGITEKSGSEYWSCNINRFRNSRRNRTKILWFCSDVCINTLTIYRGVYFPTKMNFFPSSPSLSLSTCIKTIHLNKFIRTFFNINSLIANKF